MSRAWLWIGLLVAFTGSAKELVLVDANLAAQIQAKPGVELRRLSGLDDLPGALAGEQWSRVSLISHGQPGALQLGTERLDQAFLAAHPDFLAAWNHQLTADAQLELWGCAVAKDQGHQLVDRLSAAIARPVLASTDATGPTGQGGNLSLEYGHGREPDSAPLAHLQQLLAVDLTTANSENFDSLASCANCIANNLYNTATVFGSFKVSATPTNSLFIEPTGTATLTQSLTIQAPNVGNVTFIQVASNGGGGDGGSGGQFQLKSIYLDGSGGMTPDVKIHAFRNGAEIGSGTVINPLVPGVFDLSANTDFNKIDAFTITASDLMIVMDDIMVGAPLTPITVTDAHISISGGTGGVFKIGDTVTATWNNTASGDNNSSITGVTVDFSQFGGGASVAASNSSGTWTATYTLTAGAIDAGTRNVSVTATNSDGSTTTADTTNASVDNILPTVTDARVSISGASGSGGAFKIGDTVTATWNNTAGGDNNSDTISSVTVDFSGFGGGSAVVASNSAGTWTATYLLTAGAIDASNRNVSVTATDNAGNTTTTADTSNATVDTVAPTVTSVAVPTNGTYTTGQGLDFTVNFDDVVNVTGTPRIALTLGSSTVYANYVSGGGSSALTFRHTVQAGENDVDGISVGALSANGGTLQDDNGNNATLTLNSVGSTSSVLVDTTAPTVTSVAVPANGTYTTGQSLDFTVNFDDLVNVTGTPRIALTLGSSTVYASYVGGGGSSLLTFRYTVQAGDNDSDGISVGALSANGGTLKDDYGNNATLTLNSVGSTSSVLVDTTAPTVNSVSVPANSTYTTGQNLAFTVNFSEAVTVDTSGGTPRLAMTLGSSTVYASYASGSGTSALTFSYTVQAGDNDSDGISVGALSANGGTLKDAAGNNATLTLNSVGSTSNVLVDTTAPTVTSVSVPANGTYTTGQSLDFTVNFDEAVTVTGTPRMALTLGSSTVYANYVSGSGSSALTFRHTVGAVENDADGITVGALGLNSGTLKDAAGNDATLTLNSVGSTSNVLVDTTAPTVTSVSVPANGTYTTGQSLDFTVNFDEAVTVDTSGGTPRLALTLGSNTVYADYLSGSGTSVLTLRYTVQAGDNDSDGISVGAVSANGGTLKDAAGNDATLTLNSVGSTSGVLVDTSAPTVNSVTVPANGTYTTGQSLDFTVNFDEAVTVDTSGGTPRLALTLGGSTVYAAYVSGSGGSALNFSYTVQAGDNDSDGISVGSLSTNSGTLKDAAGNDASLTLNSVGSTSNVLVDTTAPTVTSVSVPANGTYTTGQSLDFTVNFDEAVTVTGTPRMALTLGSSTVYANYVSGSGSSALTFRHTVGAVENDADGITVGALGLNSGTLKDAAGNDATLTLNSVGSTSNVLVDTTAPTVTSVSVPANGTYTTGQSLDFTVNFDEAVTVDTSGGTPRLALTLGSNTVYADYLSGSGTSVLTLRYTVQAGDNDSDGISVGAVSANGGTLKDAAGNDATLTLNSVGSTSGVLVDTSAPTVNSVTVPANGTYTTGQSLDFTVNFDEAVTVDTSGGTPRLALTLGSNTVYADYLSGSGTSVLTLRYTVQAGDNDSDGISVGAVSANGGTLKDAAGNDATLTLNSVGSTSGVLVDTSAPTVNSVTVPANGTYTTGQSLDFTVNFSKAVMVDISGGTPRLALTLGSSTVYANYISGSGTSALIFRHTIGAGENDADGITVGVLSLNNGTLKDAAGNNATLALNGVASTNSVLVDALAPSLSSSSPSDGASDVAYNANLVLTFNEAVSAGSGTLDIYDAADDSLLESNNVGSARVSFTGNSITLDPQASLTPTHSYYVQISNQAIQDMAGNYYAGIHDKSSLNFSVANAAPVAQADTGTTQEDTGVQFNVTANDLDSDGALNMASVSVMTAPAHGSTSIDTGTGVITYMPAANYNGSDSFTYRVQDIYGSSSNVATVSVTIFAVNDAPQAVGDVASTTEDTQVTVDVLANDSDIDTGDSLDPASLTLVTSPIHGTVQISNGQLRYAPADNFNGSDSFSYTVADQMGAVSNVADVMINVGSSNDAPIATSDSVTTDEDNAVMVDVLANDSDVDGSLVPASVSVLVPPTHGQVSLNAQTGHLIYTPVANYYGSDSFGYVVQDNEGLVSNQANVAITIRSVNDAPVAANNSVTLLEDASLNINVLGNDSDVDGILIPSSLELVSLPAHGVVTLNAVDGSVRYTPANDAVGDDNFTYRVLDDQGAWSNIATVALTIQPVNDTPLANADQATLDEDSSLTLAVLANDSDIDGSLQGVVIVAQPESGSVVVGSDGQVTYTPAANFNGVDSFSYQAVDNEGAVSVAAMVNLTVRAVNDAPTISGNGAATLLEGGSYHFVPALADVDGNALTVTAAGLPSWLSLNRQTGELNGSPVIGQAGQYGGIVLTVSDGVTQTSLPAFALTVLPDTDGDGIANGVDNDDDNDGMTDSYESEHGFNSLDPTDGAADADQDGVSNQQESVDGTNPHDASDYVDTVAPVMSAPTDVTVDARGLFTPVTVRKLLGLADSVSDDEVAAALRARSSDNIDGSACCSVTIDGLSHGQLLLAPGSHKVIYRTTDHKGNIGTVSQLVRVRPLVSMSKDQLAVPGQTLSFRIILNGPAPDYPFTVPYVIDNSTTLPADQYSLQAGSVTFTSGQTALRVPVTLGNDAAASGDQTLVVRLDDRTTDEQDLAAGYDPAAPDIHDINAGAKSSLVMTVTPGNVAPEVNLSLHQDGISTMEVAVGGGPVTLDAEVQDANVGDTHTFDWSGSDSTLIDSDGNASDRHLVFDPTGLNEGLHLAQVTVTDSQGASAVRKMYFRVVTALPELSADADTDGDGLSDLQEGMTDSDGDGIVDYLDNLSALNLLPEALATTEAFVMECEPGVLCRLGQYALLNGSSGSRLLESELALLTDSHQDGRFTPVGGLFDFEIADLPIAGQSVKVVIPLNEVIPANAVYRKYQDGQWRTFVEDDNNQLHSAPGSLGYCPPPGDAQWTPGLTAGDYCVQLTLEDGGPNDADGVVNANVEDPGAVSVAKTGTHNGGGAMGWFSILVLGAAWQGRRGARGGRSSAG